MKGWETFSVASDAYAASRPQYPASLFAWIASHCERCGTAWDCATGNGQAALGLASYFDRIEATDISVQQIRRSFPAANISYSVQSAEKTIFPAASFDLVAVAQALHWFDFKRFWAEVRRTAKPNAFFAAWGYAWFECAPELDAALFKPIREVLEPYWARENGIVWRGYDSQEIEFPFERVDAPSFAIDLNWDIQAILSHVATWSAYKRAIREPKAAASIAKIEQASVRQFQSWESLPLRAPLAVVAGPVS